MKGRYGNFSLNSMTKRLPKRTRIKAEAKRRRNSREVQTRMRKDMPRRNLARRP
jgi:hypothetical protein